MKRFCYQEGILVAALVALFAVSLAPVASAVTPSPTSAVVMTRVFNDCLLDTVTVTNSYPALVGILDQGNSCFGFANLNVWRFSTDGATEADFENGSSYSYSADFVISGNGAAEGGLQVAPWWSESDGRFNCRTTDGEIACFGGRLPFYSFTATYGLHYVMGDTIHLAITYQPHSLLSYDPATIVYDLVYHGVPYTSGPLAFDQGNPAEDPPHGLWGELTPAHVGGHCQIFWQTGGPSSVVNAEWLNIQFAEQPVPTKETTWGKLKNMYNN